MRTITIGKKTIELYDNIDKLPIKRFHKFNKYLLIDAGVGGNITDIDEHIIKIARYVESGDKTNAKKQLDNLRTSLFMVSEETNIKHLSFITLIKSINGKEVHDLSDENIRRLSRELNSAEKGFIDRLIESIKKKIDSELDLYFPGTFDDASIKEYFDKVRQRVLLQLDSLLRENDNSKKIEEIETFLLGIAKPRVFSGKDSIEIKYEKNFQDTCLFLKKEMSIYPENMTVLEFYNAFEYLKKNRPKQRNTINNGRKSPKV